MSNSKNRLDVKKLAVGTATVAVGSAMFLIASPGADAAENTATYSIGDKVFSDNNGNYIQDAGDTGIAGITVSVRDYAGNFVGQTTTDVNGNYSFAGLKDGKYVVNFSVPAGYSNDVANIEADMHDDIDSDGPIDVLVEVKGANITNLDQGFIPFEKPAAVTPAPAPSTGNNGGGTVTPAPTPAPATGNLSIGDHVWWDANGNNLYDEGENPVAGLKVEIYDYAGNFVDATETDAWGNYVFTGLSDGQYIVSFRNPLEWQPVIANIDNDVSETRDSDGPTNVIVNLKGASNFNVDQGYVGVGTPAPGTDNNGGGTVTPAPGTDNNGGGTVTPAPGTDNNGGGTVTPAPGSDNNGGGTQTPAPAEQPAPAAENPTPAPAEQPVPAAAPTPAVAAENPATIGKTELPDTGETNNSGLVASVMALMGGAMVFASRRRKEN